MTTPSHTTAHGDVPAIVQGGSLLLLASLFGNGINYVFGIFLGRALGPSQFGLYVLGLTLFNTVVFMAPLGIDRGMLKFVSEQLGLGQDDKARRTIAQGVTMVAFFSLLFALGLAASAGVIASALYQKPELAAALFFFSGIIPFAAITTVLLQALQAYRVVRYTVFIKYVWEPLAKLVLAAVLLQAGFGLYGVLAAMLFTHLASLGFALRPAGRIAGLGLRNALSRDHGNVKGLVAFCWPLTVADLFRVVAPRSDVMILGYWVASQEVGIYGAAFQTAAVLALVAGAFEALFAPIIGRLLARQDLTALGKMYCAVSRWTLIFSAPMFSVMLLFAGEILGLFGTDFKAGATCIAILVIGQLVHNAGGGAHTILLMSGRSRTVMWNTVTLGVILVGLNAVLIPRFGMVGAAAATSGSLVIMTVTRVVEVWGLHGIHPLAWGLVKPGLAALLAAGAALSVKDWLDPGYFPLLAAAFGIAYVMLLALFGLEEDDRQIVSMMYEKVRVAASPEAA